MTFTTRNHCCSTPGESVILCAGRCNTGRRRTASWCTLLEHGPRYAPRIRICTGSSQTVGTLTEYDFQGPSRLCRQSGWEYQLWGAQCHTTTLSVTRCGTVTTHTRHATTPRQHAANNAPVKGYKEVAWGAHSELVGVVGLLESHCREGKHRVIGQLMTETWLVRQTMHSSWLRTCQDVTNGLTMY